MWWNAIGFVPDTRMGSLGVIESLASIDAIAASTLAFGEFAPALGEAFAIEIEADREEDATGYALIRVLAIKDRVITFEYRYPFDGSVIP